jgi:CDP-diacylglycerol--glycerol-3-phosphate 3-phosphatidyltransferase
LKKRIPEILVFSRIPIAILIAVFIWIQVAYVVFWVSLVIIFGLLTDVLDGSIARKLNVSTERLRKLDSNVDQFFWVLIIISIFWWRIELIKPIWIPLLSILVLEGLTYLVSLIKFKKTVATHTIFAKFWTLTLLVFLLELAIANSTHTFYFCLVLGILSRLEILMIILLLKKWATDIPTVFVVGKVNRGEKVKKSKLFNS